MTFLPLEASERFEVLETLTENDTEVVMLALDRQLEREVFLRLPGAGIRSRLMGPKQQTIALREARMLARVSHPGVCRLLEVLPSSMGPILVIEPVSGEPLAEVLDRRGKLGPDELVPIARQIADAARAVHLVGIVHRNLGAKSVFIRPDGSAMLSGFVFAKPESGPLGDTTLVYDLKSLTEDPDKPFALPDHPAPEQIAGRPADARSDIFGFGCLLFHCLSGEAPRWEGGEKLTLAGAESVAEALPEAPEPFVRVIERCLAKSPTARYQSMREVLDALPEPVAPPAPAPAGRRRVLRLAAAASAAVLVAVLASIVWWPSHETADRGLGGIEESYHGPARRGEPRADASRKQVYRNVYESAHALLIGIDYDGDYNRSGFSPLYNAEDDVTRMAGELRGLGWPAENIQVLIGADATRSAIEAGLKLLERLVERVGPDDQVLVYYAGHGTEYRGARSGWMIPADAGMQAPNGDEGENWLHFSRLSRFYEQCEAKHILVALDCCYASLAVPRGSNAVAVRQYMGEFLTTRAHVLLTAAREKASDGEAHSPFSTAFFRTIEQAHDAPVTTTMLFANLQETLRTRARKFRQYAELSHVPTSDGSEFVFMKR